MDLSDEQIERYSRHIILSEVGGTGQSKLLDAKVLVVGVGGLGSPAAMYLAAAGIGTIGLVDSDVVDLSNLQRQIIHQTSDIGRAKVESGKNTINAINPDPKVELHNCRLNADNALDIIAGYDFVIDGTDSFASKFLVADACHLGKKPYSHAGILRFDGVMLTVIPGETACYRCLFGAPPPKDVVPTCSQAGVLGVVAGTVGVIQATEAVKYVLGIGKLLTNRLMSYNALEMKFRPVNVKRNPKCNLCGENATITTLSDEEEVSCDLA